MASERSGPTAPRRTVRLASLLFGLALVSLLPALALLGATAWQTFAAQEALAQSRLRDSATALAVALDREFTQALGALEAFAASPYLLPERAGPDLEAAHRHAQRLAARLGARVDVAAPDGAVLLTSLLPPDTPSPAIPAPGTDVRALVAHVVATGAPAVGDLTECAITGRQGIGIAAPVSRADGHVALVTIALLDAERLRSLVAAPRLAAGHVVVVRDASEMPVASTAAGPVVPSPLNSTPHALAAQTVPSAPGWTVLATAPSAVVSAPWASPLLGLAAAGGGALLLGGGLAALAARRILRPIRRLRDHALAMATPGGRRDVTVDTLPPADVAEIEQLRQGFAAAEAALAARETELAGVLEASGEGVIVVDGASRIVLVNRRGAALAGREDTEGLHGRGLWDALPDAVGGPFWDACRRAMAERIATTAAAWHGPRGRRFHATCQPRPDGGLVILFRDITEERLAAARLAESEARFRAMADNIPQLAWMARPDGAIFWFNRRWHDFTGAAPGEAEGEGWLAFHHPDHREAVAARLRRAVAIGEPWEDTFPLRGQDGAYRWFLSRARPVRDAEGRVTHWFGTHTDITAQRAAEAALREGEARLRLALDAAGLSSWEMDARSGLMTRTDRVMPAQPGLPLSGYTIEDFFRLALHPDDARRLGPILEEVRAGRLPSYRIEYRARRPDGTYFWMETHGGVMARDSLTGAPLRIGGVSRDISERKASEAALAESEARLRLALEAGQVATFSWDLASDAMMWDARMRALWALPEDMPVSREAFRAGVHPDDLPRVRASVRAALSPAGDGRLEMETRVIGLADKVERIVAAHGRVEFSEGRPIRMIGTAADVTELRRAAEVLAREAAQLEQLAERRGRALAESEKRLAEAARMEALGRLAGGIAHDFNNVLQAVQGGIKLAEKRLQGDPGGVRRFLALAGEAASRGAAVTGRLLSFARRGALHAEAIAPAPLLEGLAEMLRHTLGPDIAIRVEADRDLPELWADRSQLEAVLVNLANNARDAMPGGGEVLLRAEAVRAPAPDAAGLPAGAYLRLTVVDQGEGMPPDVLARVTEPFFTTKPKGQGTGLGLAMARGFVEQSGGTLGIGSVPGQGTTVSLWLPEATRQAAAAAPAAETGRSAASACRAAVLVAEDEPEVREILVAELGERGYAVTAAESGAAALALLEQGLRPDAVVTDLAMPGGVDGLALIEGARRRMPRLPAVLVTGHAAEAAPDRLEAVERSGPFALVRKPAAADVLAERLGRVLGQGQTGVAAE